ncbi:MAG: GntR family transcriptional regulator [Akkermansiaceae bacterium]|nr:GntR family transcriptional regulator [Armatimonadota bacterium]
MITTKKKPGSLLKYRQVEQDIRRQIAAGRWQAGDRLPGEYDFANQFNVAYLTVRHAVSNLLDEGVLIRVRGKGTFVADAVPSVLPISTRRQTALLFPANWQRIDPDYFPDLWEGFQQATESSRHRTPCISYEDAERPGGLEIGTAVACLLLEDAQQQLVERLRDGGHPVLAINHYTGRRSIPSVRIDDAAGVEWAVDHLVELGHTRIGFLLGDPGNLDGADRLRGFRSAVRRHGLRRTVEFGGGFEESGGYLAGQILFAQPSPPTAIVCASDLSAIGAMKAARESGRSTPRDLSVIGFGDFSVSGYIMPGLTTVRQSRVELGRTAAESLVRLANDEPVTDTMLAAKLIVRESTAPPAGDIK